MKNRKVIAITGITLILLVIVVSRFIFNKTPEKEVHYHAGFVVFDGGQKVDFSDSKYMFIKPCTTGEPAKPDAKTKQMEKAHLHGGVGDVVHVEAENSKWGDLFTNIGYPVDYSKVTAYLNGQKVNDLKSAPINQDDTLVVFIGPINTGLLNQAVTKERIEDVGRVSVECGE